ncbi:YggT family protein [Pseudonocardia sp. GCM10023141]|uniref:YggT family protein n=1 Tax=Pseudonocardia sp. GCM10023141 TaxID=3252653 RepID=UPI003620702E
MSVIGALLSFVLLVFLIVLVVRAILDWTGVLAPGGGGWALKARDISHRVTEPVLAPVRRVLKPVRIGDVQLDLAFTVVFVAVLILRTLVSYL